ncbi:MAG: hypothetical protein WDN50_18400 [Bradyrhizobium sp.]
MAQPTSRNNGWRPFTSHSNARGTSGYETGKLPGDIRRRRAGSIGGRARPQRRRFSLNFAAFSHGCALRLRGEKQMRARRIQRDQAREFRHRR